MQRLSDLYCRESLSLMQYVNQASPFVREPDRPLHDRLKDMAARERQSVESLGETLDAKRIPLPHTGAFSSRFTGYNFMDVRKLLPHLIADQRSGLMQLETDRESLPSPFREEIDRHASIKQMHLTELEKLTADPTVTPVAGTA
jgi:hypothetical protein